MSVAAGCVLALLLPGAARAQTVGGRVVDSASARPLSGVLVVLLDPSDAARARDLTDADGAYHLSAAAGEYRIRTLRIGFRPFTTLPLRLAAGETVRRDLVIASTPVKLDTVRVLARNPCRARPDEGATGEIWEQARTAIAAAQLTGRAKGYEAAILTYERTLAPNRVEVKKRSAALRTGHTVRPWVTLPLDSIEKVGYVYRRGDGAMIYNAPDLEMLLSDDFAAAHCFRVAREGSGEGGRVGIAFEPTRERVVPEISGTVWLDPKTAELLKLEFRYTNIGPELARAGAGGDMTFARFANGGWSISNWNIRMPVLEQTSPSRLTVGKVNTAVGGEVRLAAIQVGGGELVLVTRGSDTLWSGVRRRLTGTIVDSSTGRGVRGAHVRLDKLNVGVNADGAGRFSIPDVLPGTYEASVIDAQGSTHRQTFTFVEAETPVVLRVAPPKEGISWRLDTVAISAPFVDKPGNIPEFEARRARGVGRFITTEELRQQDERAFTEVMRLKFPDLAFRFTERGEVFIYNRRQQPPKALLGTSGSLCYVQMIVDGLVAFAMGGAEADPPDVANLLTPNFDAVEYYASVASTPPEYRSAGATCGTLILWSRRQ